MISVVERLDQLERELIEDAHEDNPDTEERQQAQKALDNFESTSSHLLQFLSVICITCYKDNIEGFPVPSIGIADKGRLQMYWTGNGHFLRINIASDGQLDVVFMFQSEQPDRAAGRFGCFECPWKMFFAHCWSIMADFFSVYKERVFQNANS